MIIVSDTTPFRYLIEIDEAHILETLFGKVIIPKRVFQELQHPKTPQKVRDWIQATPVWIEVKTADLSRYVPQRKIDQGEHEAIALALELQADRLLIDDKNGRIEAKRAGLLIVPTMAIIELAAQLDLIDLITVIDALRQTTFHLPPENDIQAMIDRDTLRKQAKQSGS